MPSSPSSGRAVRVLLADDHKLFAESLMTVLSEDERVEVVGIAENGEEAVRLAAELQPDVILMDLKMPVMDGLEATRKIRETGLPVQILLLTGTDTPFGAKDAAEAGATAFLRKERGVEELRHVFLEVASLAAVLGTPSR
ncbi:MAG TPA: response regulator transcription factor [Gaiellaceae bacterium]